MKVRTWVDEADEGAGYKTIAELCLTEGEAQQLAGHLAKAFGTASEDSVRFAHDKEF